jgi:hypothetical protein
MCGCYVPRRLRNLHKFENGKMKLRTVRELPDLLARRSTHRACDLQRATERPLVGLIRVALS